MMGLISHKTANDLTKRAARDAVARVLRDMAADMIRVMHGAGRPHNLRQEMAECMHAFEAYRAAHASYPDSHMIQQALDPERPWPDGSDGRDDDWDQLGDDPSQEQIWVLEHRSLRRDMRRASLQITASMLAGQPTQRSIADRELGQAVRAHERVTDTRRATRERAETSRPLVRQRAATTNRIPMAAHSTSPAPPCGAGGLFEPPNYAGFRSVALTDDLRSEFGTSSAIGLVDTLNQLWKAEARKPLAQGSFPSTTMKLLFIVKELRLAKLRTRTAP